MPAAVWERLRHHAVGILVAAACWAGVMVLLTATPISHAIRDWENRTLDHRFHVRGTIAQDPRIVLVDIDDRSLAAIGRWPWDRTYHARMVDVLSQSGAAVIGYDVLFEQHTRLEDDRALVDAIARAGNVYLPTGLELTRVKGAPLLNAVREVGPFPEIRAAAAGIGHISSNRDPDGTIRRVPVVVDSDGRLVPALFLAMAAGYFGAPIDLLGVNAERAVILPVGDQPSQAGHIVTEIPIDEAGMMVINYAGAWDETFEHVSFSDVLDAWQTPEGRAGLAAIVKGTICVVSNTGSGFDLKPTPLDRAYPGGGIHANALNTILTGAYLSGLSGWAAAGIAAGLAVITVVIMAASPWWMALAASGLLMMTYLGVAVVAFQYGVIVPLVLPILGSVSAGVVGLIAQHRSVAARVKGLTEERSRLVASLRDTANALRLSEAHLVDARHDLSATRSDMDGLRLHTREQVERAVGLEAALERAGSECEVLRQRKRLLEEQLKDIVIQPVFARGTTGLSSGELHREWARYSVITRNPSMGDLFVKVQRAAATRHPVLILGETGTGKDLVARAVHRMSDRSHRPFVTVNIPAIQENLIESELFGHVKGAFTGAVSDKPGKFQAAAGGTIFLDEIGEMKRELQATLLRVVQTGEVDRVGGLHADKIDVRIVAATNRDLPAMVERGTFRADLYYRLKVMTVILPPLRERPEDVEVLAEYFLDRYALESGKSMKGITVKAMARLKAHAWRGNVREIEHAIARAVALSSGDRVAESDLELLADGAPSPSAGEGLDSIESDQGPSDGEFIARLRHNQFEIGTTAEQLRVSRGTVGLRFKGICFRLLAESGGDRDKAAAMLCGGDGSADVVSNRIREYHANLLDVLRRFEGLDQAREECRRRFKNIPIRYWEGLDVLIRRYFEQPAVKP